MEKVSFAGTLSSKLQQHFVSTRILFFAFVFKKFMFWFATNFYVVSLFNVEIVFVGCLSLPQFWREGE